MHLQKLLRRHDGRDKESSVVTMPVALQLRTNVCMEFWNLESQEFEIRWQSRQKRALELWRSGKEKQEAPKTPQEYHQ